MVFYDTPAPPSTESPIGHRPQTNPHFLTEKQNQTLFLRFIDRHRVHVFNYKYYNNFNQFQVH